MKHLLLITFALGSTLHPLMGKGELPAGYVPPAEVAASLSELDPVWRAQLTTAARPRLFFAPGTADARFAALRAALPGNRKLKDIVADAKALTESPIRKYTTPEEELAAGKSKVHASEELWQRGIGDQMVLLALAAHLDADPAIKQRLKDTALEACKYTTWGRKLENMDLSAAHVARGIAIARDWHPDLFTAEELSTITTVIRERCNQLMAGLYGKAYWGDNYGDNHNHVSAAGLGICGAAFYDEIPEAPEWLAAARLNFQRVAKYFPEDGSSHEGVSYWSYAQSFILQYIEGTRHIMDSANIYDAPFMRNAVPYRLHSSVGGMATTLPWGDASTKDFYGPQHVLYRLADQYSDGSAAWLAAQIPFKPRGGLDVGVWMALWKNLAIKPVSPTMLDWHHWDGDIITTRSGWENSDYLLSIKSGFTRRNHSHLDAGALALGYGADWLLTAPGYGKGGGNPDFWGSKRFTYYSNATESHSTLLINGANQRKDDAARATITTFFHRGDLVWTAVDLTDAYDGPSHASRHVLHRRGDYALVLDEVKAPVPLKVEWLGQFPSAPEVAGSTLHVQSGKGQLRLTSIYPAMPFTPRAPTVPNVDVAEGSVNTHALVQNGEHSRFAVILQPGRADQDLPKLETSYHVSDAGYTSAKISAGMWQDHVQLAPDALSMTGEALGLAQLEITGTALIVRKVEAGMDSGMALGSTQVKLPWAQWEGSTPANFAWSKGEGETWLLKCNQDVRGSLKAADEFTLITNEPAVDGASTAYTFLISPR